MSDRFDHSRVITWRTPTETGQQDGSRRVKGIRTKRTRPGEMEESRMIFAAPPKTRFVDAGRTMKPMGTHERWQTHSARLRTGESPIARSLNVQPTKRRPVISEGLFDFLSFMPTAIEKSFPLSSAPGMTKDVREVITIGLRPTRLDEIQILGDLMGENPRTSGGETQVLESLTQGADRTRRAIPASNRAIDRAGNSTQEMFDSENFQMGITAEEKSTDVFVGYEAFTVTTAHIGPKTKRGSDSRETGDPTVWRLRHGEHSNIQMEDSKGKLNWSQ